jgi:hypothetical protein
MASYTVTEKNPLRGGLYMSYGTYTDVDVAGTNVVTGLGKVVCAFVTPDSASTTGCKESATAGTITVYPSEDGTEDGFWMAIGR